jgi:hypothetical protein
MAMANFGVLQALPDPYERIRQASAGWGALPGVVGQVQQRWNDEKLKDVHGRVLKAWDYQSPKDTDPGYQFGTPEEEAEYAANRAIFSVGDKDPQKFRKAANYFSPYDTALSQKMLGMADVRDREEAQLQDEMNQRIAQQKAKEEESKAKRPYENVIRAENAFQDIGRSIDQLFQRRGTVSANDTKTLGEIDAAINSLREQQKRAYDARQQFAQGSDLEQLYPAAPVVANEPPPAVAPQAAPVAAPPVPTLARSSDLARAKLSVDQMVQAGTISPDEATRQKTALDVQAGELSRKEGAAAGAKAKADAEEQKRLGVLVGSAKALGESSIMMGAIGKVASGNLDDLSVKAMLSALPVENARTIGGIGEKDQTLLNTLRSKLGTDTEYTPEDKAALMDIAKNLQTGYQNKVDRLRQEWGKLSPAQQEQVKTDFSAFSTATQAATQSAKQRRKATMEDF